MTRTLRIFTLFLGSAMAAIAAGEKKDETSAVVDAAQERAKVKRTDADFQAITAALQMYKINAGAYPTEKQGLKALVDKPVDAPLPRRWVKMMAKVPHRSVGPGIQLGRPQAGWQRHLPSLEQGTQRR
jgi:type II secretion system protein G